MPVWPAWFPEDCPPKQAMPADELVFRVVASDPPAARDFLAAAVIPNHPRFGDYRCQNCGLSVFREIQDARNCQRLMLKHRKVRIAAAHLNLPDVLFLSTPTSQYASHCTLWIPELNQLEVEFNVVE